MLVAPLPMAAVEFSDNGSLLERARAGDLEAFDGICREHDGRLFRQALTLCGNEALAEDLAQETLVEAWKSLRRYNGRCQYFTWLCAILLNRFRNEARLRGRMEKRALATEAQSQVDEGATPEEALWRGEQAARVRECLAALPEKHRHVVFLRFYVEESLPEIAAALGCSVGTVKSRLFHALEKLRRMNFHQ